MLQRTDPEYTKEARARKIHGKVILGLEVHADGGPYHIRVVRSLEPGLDRNVIEAVSHWVFAPGEKDGKPVAVAVTLEIDYRLL